jgi:hypothetical protein
VAQIGQDRAQFVQFVEWEQAIRGVVKGRCVTTVLVVFQAVKAENFAGQMKSQDLLFPGFLGEVGLDATGPDREKAGKIIARLENQGVGVKFPRPFDMRIELGDFFTAQSPRQAKLGQTAGFAADLKLLC